MQTDAITKKLDELENLWHPHKQYPIYFIEYPQINKALDAFQTLINIAKAAHERIFSGHGNPCDSMLRYRDCSCGHADLEKALKELAE